MSGVQKMMQPSIPDGIGAPLKQRGRIVVNLLCAVLVFLFGPSALSQPRSEEQGPDIIVEAPRKLPVPPHHAAHVGQPEFIATVRYSVFYGDLNLAMPSGRARLMKRIENTARQACDYLDRRFPLDKDPECAARAVKGATPAVDAAILAASGEKR